MFAGLAMDGGHHAVDRRLDGQRGEVFGGVGAQGQEPFPQGFSLVRDRVRFDQVTEGLEPMFDFGNGVAVGVDFFLIHVASLEHQVVGIFRNQPFLVEWPAAALLVVRTPEVDAGNGEIRLGAEQFQADPFVVQGMVFGQRWAEFGESDIQLHLEYVELSA